LRLIRIQSNRKGQNILSKGDSLRVSRGDIRKKNLILVYKKRDVNCLFMYPIYANRIRKHFVILIIIYCTQNKLILSFLHSYLTYFSPSELFVFLREKANVFPQHVSISMVEFTVTFLLIKHCSFLEKLLPHLILFDHVL